MLLVMSADFENIIRQMMTPSPKQRPDVDTLLRWPRIQMELENRRKIAPVKYMVCTTPFAFPLPFLVCVILTINFLLQKTCCRKSKNFIWRNICKYKDYVGNFRIFGLLMTLYAMIFPSPRPTRQSDDISTPSFLDMSDTDSPHKNFSLSNTRNSDDSSMRAKIVNSTPVIRHGVKSRSNILR